jgi:hypothetical protein
MQDGKDAPMPDGSPSRASSAVSASTGRRVGRCREAEEAHPQVAIPQALEGVFTAEDGGEQGEIGGRRGIERTRRAPAAIPHRLHEALEGAIGGRGIVDDGEGIEVAVIGGRGDGGVAREIRHALQQGVPPESPVGAAAGAATDFELVRVIDVRAAGAIFIGKTNTPEFGLGSHTYSNVFGTTLNAYDQTRTAGGSSGGAAVALALRMLPVADGSDFFGSLRNPAGWNNVLGFRPSFGRVPGVGADAFVQQGGVEGPMARTATDLATFLATIAGYDPRAPLSIEQDPSDYPDRLDRRWRGVKVAWLGDLGGYLPTEPGVLELTRGRGSSTRPPPAKTTAAARPMPEVVPVMSATLPSKRRVTSSLLPKVAVGRIPRPKHEAARVVVDTSWDAFSAIGVGLSRALTCRAGASSSTATRPASRSRGAIPTGCASC